MRSWCITSVFLIVAALAVTLWSATTARKQAAPSLVSTSWDGAKSLTVVPVAGRLDRNFYIVYQARDSGSRKIFSSPDEGMPGNDYSAMWSLDSRYVVLFTLRAYVIPGASLDDGRQLYLLFDTLTGQVKCNASQLSLPRFGRPEFMDKFGPQRTE